MITLISLLRGINMAGHNSVKMKELSDLYIELGYIDAECYIQSGNVIFSSDDSIPVSAISAKIENAIFKKFSYNIPVLIRSVREMKELSHSNPFLNEKNFDPAKMAVIFLYEGAAAPQILKVKDVDYPPDKFKIIGKEIFTYCPNGFGKTKIYTNFFEKKMGVTGTGRSWKSITTIINIAERR
jgi:uncharacterized protein (DUF1697 family)